MSEEEMNFLTWKTTKYVTGCLLFLFLLYVILNGIRFKIYGGPYPHPAMGIEIKNWMEDLLLETWMTLFVLWMPLLICLIIFIVAIKKTRKKQRKGT